MDRQESRVIEYEKPMIVDYGDLTELTGGDLVGTSLDQAFPAGTPFDDLRFSIP